MTPGGAMGPRSGNTIAVLACGMGAGLLVLAMPGTGAGGDRPGSAPTVAVPAGPFVMGSERGAADERPARAVALSAFRLDRVEVTNARYRACVRAGACTPPVLAVSHRRPRYFDDPAFDDHPVIFVSWHQAEAFCRFARGRLPTEAEWEKAARGPAPDRREFPWGDDPPDCARANFGGAQGCVGDTDAVGRRPAGASPYGADDMAGNVWEWVADWYEAGYYGHGPATDPSGPPAGHLKVMRGGCWESGASSLRVSCRRAELPGAWADNVGFRCAYPWGASP
jgi:eukaryotic-like serine/threonine-protein kinase